MMIQARDHGEGDDVILETVVDDARYLAESDAESLDLENEELNMELVAARTSFFVGGFFGYFPCFFPKFYLS